jgi:PKD repeat protein
MAVWDQYTGLIAGFESRLQTGATFTPRSYCDDPTIGPVGIYVNKEPAAKLLLTPLVQFINTNIAWDISQSVSTTSTIDTYDITFGGGGASDLSAQSWAGAKTGNVQYTTAGTYTVTATVTDVLGSVSKDAKQVVTIEPNNFQRVYIGTSDGGMYILTPAAGPTAANTGLTGNSTNFRAMRMHPAYKDLPTGNQHLWAATEDGVAYTTDGGDNWIPPMAVTTGPRSQKLRWARQPMTPQTVRLRLRQTLTILT